MICRQEIGHGSYGKCCTVFNPYTSQQLVIKTFYARTKKQALDALVMEAKLLKAMQCEGVQRLVGVCVQTCELVTCFAGQNAKDYFRGGPSFADIVSVTLQLARILRRIHNLGYAHNDIKLQNVCVSV